MRKVVSNREVPHLWAHQSQSEARNSNGSLYFNGDTIYSYGSHFPIAQHVTSPVTGERAILVTTSRYSVTTSGHIGCVRNAIPHGVREIFAPLWNQAGYGGINHSSVLASLVSELNDAIEAIATAKNIVSRQKRVGIADGIRETAIEVKEFFGLPQDVPVIPADGADIRAAIAERERVAEEKRKAAAIVEAERQRLWEIENEAKKQAWLNGERNGYESRWNTDTLLRVVDGEVETSRGAYFPLEHARKGLALVKAVMARGEEWHTNGHTCHLGHYKIDRITPDGTVYAGCHVVKFEAIARIAPMLESVAA